MQNPPKAHGHLSKPHASRPGRHGLASVVISSQAHDLSVCEAAASDIRLHIFMHVKDIYIYMHTHIERERDNQMGSYYTGTNE